MNLFSKLFQSNISITKKLLFLNLVIFIVFGLISGVMFLAFRNLEELTTGTMDRNVSHVLYNARMGRELSSTFDKTHLLIGTFYRNDKRWEDEGDILLDKTGYLSDQTVNKNLKSALSDFKTKLELFFRQCLEINDISGKIHKADTDIARHLKELEEVITLLAAKGEDISAFEQVSVLIPSYRETLLKAAFLFVSLKPIQSDTRDVEPIVILLDDLHQKARTTLVSDPEIEDYGHKIIDSVSEYKRILINFNNAVIAFHEQLSELSKAKEKAVTVMKQVDEDILSTFGLMQEKTAEVIQSSIRFVYILCGSVIVLFGILTYLFFLLNIRKPMKLICEGLESIGDGDMDARIRLERTDEWSLIEDSVNRMVSEVWNSYAELYSKNEELQKMHLELEASMKHLELEVSERRLAEEELKKTQGYIKNIIDSMPSVMIGVDAEARITHWNMVAEKMVGVKAEETRGRLVSDVYPALASQMDQILKSLKERKPQKTEKQIRHSENEIRYEDIMIYPLVANSVEGAVIRIDDVTSRVRIEEMMIQTEKMMSVGGLAAGMAHEINNPLGVILQSVQNASRRLSPELDVNVSTALACGTDLEAVRAYLEKRGIFRYLNGISDAGTRAARIVTNMLNFSRHSDCNMVPEDMNKLLDDTVELAANDYDLKKKYDFRHIEIIREYDSQLPQINCSPTEIEQVILNLLRNSAQAMAEINKKTDHPDTDTGTASPVPLIENGIRPRIILRTRRDVKYMYIEVEDNGPGMDRKISKRIFEPFYTTKSVGVGTGMGLSVSYFIIANNHKGSMIVESEPGRGAKFIIRLPLKQ